MQNTYHLYACIHPPSNGTESTPYGAPPPRLRLGLGGEGGGASRKWDELQPTSPNSNRSERIATRNGPNYNQGALTL